MSCAKLNGIPLYRIYATDSLSSPNRPYPPIPNCIDIEYRTVGDKQDVYRRLSAHLNAMQVAVETNVSGCIIFEDTIDLLSSIARWRFSMEIVLYQATLFHQKLKTKISNGVLQLYSDNVRRVHEQVSVFQISHQWFQSKTLQDTGGLKCYYINRGAMNELVQKYSMFSGEWDIHKFTTSATPDLAIFQIPTFVVQLPIFFETNMYSRTKAQNIQAKSPMLFHDIPLHISNRQTPTQFRIYLHGFPPSNFYPPNDAVMSLISNIFRYTDIWPFDVVKDIDSANILIEMSGETASLVRVKPWDFAIQCAATAITPDPAFHMTVADFTSCKSRPTDIVVPAAFFYMHKHNYYKTLLFNTMRLITHDNIPSNKCFLCIHHPPKSVRAQILLNALMNADMVHSYGSYRTNCPALTCAPTSTEYALCMKKYQFVLCFDSAEAHILAPDIVLPLVLRCVPIYDGQLSVALQYFNHQAFCFFNETGNDAHDANTLFHTICALSEQPDAYLRMANSPKISNSGQFETQHITKLQAKTCSILSHHFERLG